MRAAVIPLKNGRTMNASLLARGTCILLLAVTSRVEAQYIPFTSGPIPLCDTSTFTANVTGVGWLGDPWMSWSSWLEQLTINITSDHPQTLSISLTSPEGTVLLLSAFNGNGGQNYTNTTFYYGGGGDITTGTAPFTGGWSPQGGSFSAFNGEYGDGTWTITVVDTACANGGIGPGGSWTPGWFDGNGGGSGGFAFGFSGPPPCSGWVPSDYAYVCPGQGFDLLGYYSMAGMWYSFYFSLNGDPVVDPSNVTTPGSYQVEAYDNWEGCTYFATFDVLNAPVVDLGPDLALDQCSGNGPVNLNTLFPLAGAAPTWSLGGTTLSGAAISAAVTSGNYQLVGSNVNNCNDTAIVTLNITPSPSLGADQTISICQGGSADLTATYNTAGLTTAWTFGGSSFSTPGNATDLGTYTLVATSADGCSDEALVTLNVGAQPALGVDASLSICDGESIDLTTVFNTAGFATSWELNGDPIAAPIGATVAGTYSVTAGSSSNCSDEAHVTLTVDALPMLGTDQTMSICGGSSADLTALFNTTGLSTSWSFGGSTFATPGSATAAGTYTLVALNPAGCGDTAIVILNVQSQVMLGADETRSFCDNTTLDLTTIFDTDGLTTTWTRLGAPVANPSAVASGGTYTLIASAGASCGDTALVVVEAYLAPQLAPDMMASVCAGEGEDLVSYFSLTGLSTQWSLSGAPVPDPASATVEGTYRLIATNTEGCSDTAFVDLDVDEPPVAGPDQTVTTCANTATDLTALYAISTNAAVWTLDGSTVDDPVSATVAGMYTLTLTNAVGCSTEASVTLAFEPAPTLGGSASITICQGASTDLTTLFNAAGLSTTWTRNGAEVTDPSATDVAGNYRLVATNAAGCTDTAFAQLTVLPPPVLGPDRTITLCPWGSVDLTAQFLGHSSDATYLFNGDLVNDPTAVSEPGVYTVSITNAGGCSDEASITVSHIECLCEADFSHDAKCAQDPVQFMLLADSLILGAHWDFGAAAPSSNAIHPQITFVPGEPVLVTLEATLSCGVVQVQREIIIPDCADLCNVWIPTSFTPDGDDRNDVWAWKSECVPEDLSMNIFDRLGELVFSTNDPGTVWDGTYAGKAAPTGVYVYRIGYRLPYQKRKQVMGSITLVR